MNIENSDSNKEMSIDSFVNLLSQSERQLYSFILSLVPNWSEADEIAQQNDLYHGNFGGIYMTTMKTKKY